MRREREGEGDRTIQKERAYNSLCRKTSIDITIPILAIEIRQRQSPPCRVRISSCDIGGYAAPGPEIDLNIGAAPVKSVYAASCAVEWIAVAAYWTLDAAA